MNRAQTRCAAIAGLTASLALGGCLTLLPKTVPAALYRFGPAPVGPAATMANADVSVRFPPAAGGDGILTITGDRAAYIDGARWVAPAALLFEAAARSTLTAPETAPADAAPLRLAIDVLRFEADYDHGREAPPTVRIEAVFTLTDSQGRPHAVRSLSQRDADANRVGAIVAAYDLAMTDALQDMNRLVSGRPLRPPPARP